jgi:hypothetical protein
MFPGFGLGLLKDTDNLTLKLREFHGEDRAPRVQDEIETRRQKIDVSAQDLAHAALDAIALVGFAYDFANGEADARRGWSECFFSRLRRQKPAHRGRMPFAAGSVSAQIIGVLAQARVRQSLARGRL